jgi:hypothetical protein
VTSAAHTLKFLSFQETTRTAVTPGPGSLTRKAPGLHLSQRPGRMSVFPGNVKRRRPGRASDRWQTRTAWRSGLAWPPWRTGLALGQWGIASGPLRQPEARPGRIESRKCG